MKITDIELIFYKWQLPATIQWVSDIPAIDMSEVMPLALMKVSTDEGIEGYSSCRGADERSLRILKPLVVGQDPFDREKIWQNLWRATRLLDIPAYTHAALDVALWDIGGKAANLPIYKLLGAYTDKVLAYASSRTLPSPEAYAEEVLKHKEAGYTAYKLHAHGDPKKDVAACTAVRKAVGDEMVLMLDAVAAYNHEQALWVGRELEKLGFHWYEEPLRDFDIQGYVELSRALDIPIAGVEVVPGSLYSTPEYILRQAVDIIRSDVNYKRGITPLKKTATLAEAFGMMCEIHTTGNPLSNVANLHVMCSIKNTEYHEILVPEDWFSTGVIEDVRIDKEGYVHVPQKPGLGLDIDWDYIDKHRI